MRAARFIRLLAVALSVLIGSAFALLAVVAFSDAAHRCSPGLSPGDTCLDAKRAGRLFALVALAASAMGIISWRVRGRA